MTSLSSSFIISFWFHQHYLTLNQYCLKCSLIIIYLFPNYFLNLIYNTNLGINYIKVLAPFMLMYFIDMPLSNSLQALDKSKESMYITIGSSVIKLLIIFITSFFKIGMYSLIISIIVSLLFSTLCYIKTIKKVLY